MKDLFALLALTASLFLFGSLDALTFNNPYSIPTTQDPVRVFTVDVNGDGVPDLLYETEGSSTKPSTMSVFFGQSSGGYVAGPTLGATLTASAVGMESGVMSATHVASTAAINEQVVSSSLGTPSQNEWTWMGGSNTVVPACPSGEWLCGLTGVYGTLGAFTAGSFPGGRADAASWTDNSGNLWLFGGNGVTFPFVRDDTILNDLWEFNPSTNQWAWIGGNDQVGSNTGTGNPRGTGGAGVGYGWPVYTARREMQL